MPILAAGLIALLRYSFGSLFVVGESVAGVLLHSAGADIAGTVQRLQGDPWPGALQSGFGIVLSLAAAGLAPRQVLAAMLVAAAAAAWAMWLGSTAPAALLSGAVVCGGMTLAWRPRGPP